MLYFILSYIVLFMVFSFYHIRQVNTTTLLFSVQRRHIRIQYDYLNPYRSDVCTPLTLQSRISHVDDLLLIITVTREIRNNEVLLLAFENGENQGLLATHDSGSACLARVGACFPHSDFNQMELQ